MNPNGRADASTPTNPKGLPHGTTQDQISEMESEGQAAKPGQQTDPSDDQQTDSPAHEGDAGAAPTDEFEG